MERLTGQNRMTGQLIAGEDIKINDITWLKVIERREWNKFPQILEAKTVDKHTKKQTRISNGNSSSSSSSSCMFSNIILRSNIHVHVL